MQHLMCSGQTEHNKLNQTVLQTNLCIDQNCNSSAFSGDTWKKDESV